MIRAQFQMAGSLTTGVCLYRPCSGIWRPLRTLGIPVTCGSHGVILTLSQASDPVPRSLCTRDYSLALRLQSDREMNVSFCQNCVQEQ